ncbi:hypothetical protein KL938_001401 [Ogataea parapolymorpha]|nr:hypothetical protein KL938_001401 [Ogataea parapolymorpha]
MVSTQDSYMSESGHYNTDRASFPRAKIIQHSSPPYTQDSNSMSTVQDEDDFKNIDRSSSFQTSTSSSIRDFPGNIGPKMSADVASLGFYSGPSLNDIALNNSKHATHVRRSIVVSPSMSTITLSVNDSTTIDESYEEEPTKKIGMTNSPSLQALGDILNAKMQTKPSGTFTSIQEEPEPTELISETTAEDDTVIYRHPVNQSYASFFTAHSSTSAPDASDLISLSSTIKEKPANDTPTLMTPNLFSPSMIFNEPVETFKMFDDSAAIPNSNSFNIPRQETSVIHEIGYDEQESFVAPIASPRAEQRYSMRLVDESPEIQTPVAIQEAFPTPVSTPQNLSVVEVDLPKGAEPEASTPVAEPEKVFTPQTAQETPQSVSQEKDLPALPKNNKRLSFRGLFKNKKHLSSTPSLATPEHEPEPTKTAKPLRPKSFAGFEESRQEKKADQLKDRRKSLLSGWKRKSLGTETEKAKRKSLFGRNKTQGVAPTPAHSGTDKAEESDKENRPAAVKKTESQTSSEQKSLLDTYGFNGQASGSEVGVVLSTPLETQSEFVDQSPLTLQSPKYVSPADHRKSMYHENADVSSEEIQAESDVYRLDTPSPVNGNFYSPERPTLAPARDKNSLLGKRENSYTRLLAGEALFPKRLAADEVQSIVTLERSRSMKSIKSARSSMAHSQSVSSSIVEMLNNNQVDGPIVTSDGMTVVRSPQSARSPRSPISVKSSSSRKQAGILKKGQEPLFGFGLQDEELSDIYNMIQFGDDDLQIDTDFHLESEDKEPELEPAISFQFENKQPELALSSPQQVPITPDSSPEHGNWEVVDEWEDEDQHSHRFDAHPQSYSISSSHHGSYRLSLESAPSETAESPVLDRPLSGLQGPVFTPSVKSFGATRNYSFSYDEEPSRDFEDYVAEASITSEDSEGRHSRERIRKSRRMSLISKLNKRDSTGSKRGKNKSQSSIRLSIFGSKSSIDTKDLVSSPMASPMPEIPRVRFSSKILLFDTYGEHEYDRKPDQATCNQLTPQLALEIKNELNEVKAEMAVHELSRCYTHFF